MLRCELDVGSSMFDVWARQNSRENENRFSTAVQRAVPLALIALLRRPLDRRHSVAAKPSFPLTLTLGEKEQPPPGASITHTDFANSIAGEAERRRTILPLPALPLPSPLTPLPSDGRGEPRGEGRLPAATAAAQAGERKCRPSDGPMSKPNSDPAPAGTCIGVRASWLHFAVRGSADFSQVRRDT